MDFYCGRTGGETEKRKGGLMLTVGGGDDSEGEAELVEKKRYWGVEFIAAFSRLRTGEIKWILLA